MFLIKKKSAWKFDTSGSAGLGWGRLAASGGVLDLKDPNENIVRFMYGGFGTK